jgi:hypothetical protein
MKLPRKTWEEDVAQRDVDDPPEIRAEAQRELAGRSRHVGLGEVERQGEEPQDDERCGDRPLHERLSGIEQAGDLV